MRDLLMMKDKTRSIDFKSQIANGKAEAVQSNHPK